MSSTSIWICDKCRTRGSRAEVPGAVQLEDTRSPKGFIYLDLCIPCTEEVGELLHNFMNPKREYPPERKVLKIPVSKSVFDAALKKKD